MQGLAEAKPEFAALPMKAATLKLRDDLIVVDGEAEQDGGVHFCFRYEAGPPKVEPSGSQSQSH